MATLGVYHTVVFVGLVDGGDSVGLRKDNADTVNGYKIKYNYGLHSFNLFSSSRTLDSICT